MLKETIITVQTCDLKVDINCNGCAKDIEKMMHKIEGVYKSNVDKEQGKVTVTGVMDMDSVFKKLKKAGMSAQLWDANPAAVSKHQKLQLGGSDRGDQLKDAGGKALPLGESSSTDGCGARSGGGTNDATMVLPQLTPAPQQHVPNIHLQIEQKLQMLQSGKRIGGVQEANNDNKNDVGKKLYQDAAGSQVKNGAIGQLPHNGALGTNRSQAKIDNGVGVGSQIMGRSMSVGPYKHLDGYNMQPYGGGAIHGLGIPASGLPGNGFYPSNANADSSGTEMMIQQVARNTMPQQPYIVVQPQQEPEKMMNAHYPHSQNAHYGPGWTGYQMMGYGNGHGHPQQHYPPPMYYPMPMPPQHDSIFSDENPNICSVM